MRNPVLLLPLLTLDGQRVRVRERVNWTGELVGEARPVLFWTRN
jgi:hypothetical protein